VQVSAPDDWQVNAHIERERERERTFVEPALNLTSTATRPPFVLRDETPADVEAIERVTRKAFLNQPHSNQSEVAIIAGLRGAGALTLSLVAQSGSRVVGQVSVSPVAVSGGAPGWYGFGPLSVDPDFHGQGIGTELVWQCLRAMRQRGAAGCVVLGEPAYFGRFGFRSTPALSLEGAPPGCFLVRPYQRVVPLGTVRYHAAFDLSNPSDWTFP
jgi:putative acetyltransferase